MAKASKSKKRHSSDITPADPLPAANDHTTSPSLPPPTKLLKPSPSTHSHPRPLLTELESLSIDVDGRCTALSQQAETDVSLLRQALSRQLLKLPPAVRSMPLRTFALTHSLSVSSVTMQEAMASQRQLAQWVQATPRMRGGRGRGELEALKEGGVLKEYMNVLMTAQRMTRATARKAGLIPGVPGEAVAPHGVLVDIANVSAAVYQTPHSRKL